MGDPMDLGGFMQNFVLKNPFQQIKALKEPATTSPPSHPSSASSASTCVASSPPVVSPAPYISIAPKGGPEKGRAVEGLEVTSPKLDVSATASLSSSSVSVASASGFGLQQKAHVGSNRTFAMHLKHKRVADSHTQLQIWLWRHFKYVPGFTHHYPSRLLLQHAQKHFPAATSMVLSRVIKFSFPHVAKVNNKTGSYFEGLVRRPRLADLQDPVLCRLARRSHRNALLLSRLSENDNNDRAGAEEYDVETVAGVLYWVVVRLGGEDEVLSARETYSKMMQLHIAETQLDLGVDLGDVESEEEDGGDVVGAATRSGRKRRATTSRFRSLRKKRRNSADDWQPGLNGNDDDREWQPTTPIRSSSHLIRRPRRASLSPTKSYTEPLDSDTPDIKVEAREDDDNDNNAKDSDDDTDTSPKESTESTVRIKDEPVDRGYEGNRQSNSEPVPEKLIGTLRDTSVHLSSQTGGVEKDLQVAQQQNQHLSLCLRESQKTVLSLQGQLAERDIVLSQLAEEFFDVKQRFEKLSGQFKRALRGSLQSNLNNNENT